MISGQKIFNQVFRLNTNGLPKVGLKLRKNRMPFDEEFIFFGTF